MDRGAARSPLPNFQREKDMKPGDKIEVHLRREGAINNRAIGIPPVAFTRGAPQVMTREDLDAALEAGLIRPSDIVSVRVLEGGAKPAPAKTPAKAPAKAARKAATKGGR